jgi:murein peptide amidase A
VDGWRVSEIGRSRGGSPLHAFLPRGAVEGVLVAATHGEEPETLFLARRLLETVPAAEACFAVVPCLNPDGVLAAQRQNAAGVDLNRNFPASTWIDAPSFTYPPGCTERVRGNRTNRSSPGSAPGSEPETQALVAFVEAVEPALVVDLHTPLELLLVTDDVPPALAGALAARTGLDVHADLGSAAPGALRDWCADRRLACITYELEHAGMRQLCARHLPALAALAAGALLDRATR